MLVFALAWLFAFGASPGHATFPKRLRAKLHRPRSGAQLRLAEFDVPPGGEREVCEAIQLDNRVPIDVSALQFASPTGAGYVSHHFALFVDDNDDFASLPQGAVTTAGCIGFGQNFGAIIAGVQAPRQTIVFPRGVGFTFKPHQIFLLDLHYINDSTRPLRVDGAVNLLRARKGSIVHHARAFQLGTFHISIPPDADGSASAHWTAPFPMNVVELSTHSHKHTMSVDVDVLRAGVDTGQELQTTDWQHPTLMRLTTPLRLAAGDGFRWTCNYYNNTPNVLRFGETSQDEMCFAIGAFYLDDDAMALPPVPGCLGGDVALTCPGL